jgi:proline iminopeptidase
MKKLSVILLGMTLIWAFGCKEEEEPELHVKDGYVTVEDGKKLYYRTVGDGPETIIIPAGFYLEKEFELLANKDRTLIFYDVRSRGRSDKVTDAARIGMNFDISDLEALRQHFGKEKVSLIGWSYLGAMVILYAHEYQDHVKRVIQVAPLPPTKDVYFSATTTPIDNESQARLDKMREEGIDKTDPEGFTRAYWEAYFKIIFYDSTNITSFRSEYYKFPNEMPDNVIFQFGGILGSIGEWDWRELAKGMKVPVLTIHGDHDTIPMEGAREWAASLPNARLLEVTKAGHLPFVERPEVFYPAVESFLNGEWPEKAVDVGETQ